MTEAINNTIYKGRKIIANKKNYENKSNIINRNEANGKRFLTVCLGIFRKKIVA